MSDRYRLNYLTAVVRIYTQDRNRDRGFQSARIEVKMTQLDLKKITDNPMSFDLICVS